MSTLYDYQISMRCKNCGLALPDHAHVEEFRSRTSGVLWILAECPECKYKWPKQIEAELAR